MRNHGHDLGSFAALGLAYARPSFLRGGEGSVNEGLPKIQIALKPQIRRQRFEGVFHDAGANPPLEATVAGLVGRIAVGEVCPRGARSQHPQDAVQDRSAVFPWAAATIFSPYRLRDKLVENGPLGIGQVSWIVGHGELRARAAPA